MDSCTWSCPVFQIQFIEEATSKKKIVTPPTGEKVVVDLPKARKEEKKTFFEELFFPTEAEKKPNEISINGEVKKNDEEKLTPFTGISISSDTDYSIDDELSEYSDSKNSSNVLSFNSSDDQSRSNDEYILEQKHPPIFNGNYKDYILYEELKGLKENIKTMKNKNKKLRQSIIKYKDAEKEMKANIKKLNEVIKFSSFAYMEKKGKQRKKGVMVPKSTSIIPFVNPLKS